MRFEYLTNPKQREEGLRGWGGDFFRGGARGSHPHTSLWASRGPLRRVRKNHPRTPLAERRAAVFFPPRPLTPKDNRPAPPRFQLFRRGNNEIRRRQVIKVQTKAVFLTKEPL
jgi:hypothetical protein